MSVISKYPLEDFERLSLFTEINLNLKIDERVNGENDAIFQELYDKELTSFLEEQREVNAELPKKLKELEEQYNKNKSDATPVAAIITLKEKSHFHFKNDEIIPFDEKVFKDIFDNDLENRIKELPNVYPKIILDKIPDKRIYCLGYANKKFQRLINIMNESLAAISEYLLNEHIAEMDGTEF